MTRPVSNRYEFVLFFDVTNGNPNGDPDAGNLPRLDPETSHGLVSDVALKRRVRNFVSLAAEGKPGHDIYINGGTSLNARHRQAWAAVMPDVQGEDDLKRLPRDQQKARELTAWMCANFWDIRTFGAVMTTGVNAGQVRGPVQLTFARPVEPVLPLEILITRVAATTEQDVARSRALTMGRKHILPYALYRAHGFVSAPLASHPAKGTGFSEDDLELLWQALVSMFEHDRSASRGELATRRLLVFRHQSALGNANAQSLFERVRTWRVGAAGNEPVGSPATSQWPPARSWSDYCITVDSDHLPAGVELLVKF